MEVSKFFKQKNIVVFDMQDIYFFVFPEKIHYSTVTYNVYKCFQYTNKPSHSVI